MFEIVLVCRGVPAGAGPEAARDITTEFAQHRPWHTNVRCSWHGAKLVLEAENDVDANGLALLDEFSDSLAAYISEPFDGDIAVESVTDIGAESAG